MFVYDTVSYVIILGRTRYRGDIHITSIIAIGSNSSNNDDKQYGNYILPNYYVPY